MNTTSPLLGISSVNRYKNLCINFVSSQLLNKKHVCENILYLFFFCSPISGWADMTMSESRQDSICGKDSRRIVLHVLELFSLSCALRASVHPFVRPSWVDQFVGYYLINLMQRRGKILDKIK